MRLLQRIAHARVAGREHLVALPSHARGIQLQLHQFVHVVQDQHVAVQLHDAVIFDQREGGELAPAVVKAWVIREVFGHLGQQVLDMLFRNAPLVQRLVPLFWKGLRVKGNKRVLGTVLLEAGVEGEEAGEVGRVRNERRPDYAQLSVGS